MAMLILINAGTEAARFHLPQGHWHMSLDSALATPPAPDMLGPDVTVAAGSVCVALQSSSS
jgi:hypothetical protein